MSLYMLIKKHQKEVKFLKMRLNTSLFMGSNNKLIVKEGLRIHSEIVEDLKKLVKHFPKKI